MAKNPKIAIRYLCGLDFVPLNNVLIESYRGLENVHNEKKVFKANTRGKSDGFF